MVCWALKESDGRGWITDDMRLTGNVREAALFRTKTDALVSDFEWGEALTWSVRPVKIREYWNRRGMQEKEAVI